MLRTTANTLATGLLFLGLLHSLEVIAPGRAIDGKQSCFQDNQSQAWMLREIKCDYHNIYCDLCLHARRVVHCPGRSIEWSNVEEMKTTRDNWSSLLFLSLSATCKYFNVTAVIAHFLLPEAWYGRSHTFTIRLKHRPQNLLKVLVYRLMHLFVKKKKNSS